MLKSSSLVSPQSISKKGLPSRQWVSQDSVFSKLRREATSVLDQTQDIVVGLPGQQNFIGDIMSNQQLLPISGPQGLGSVLSAAKNSAFTKSTSVNASKRKSEDEDLGSSIRRKMSASTSYEDFRRYLDEFQQERTGAKMATIYKRAQDKGKRRAPWFVGTRLRCAGPTQAAPELFDGADRIQATLPIAVEHVVTRRPACLCR